MTNERAQTELAERCENATGPDRELDCAISLALVEVPSGCKAVASELSSQAGLVVDRVGRLHGTVDYQPFTASLDAAMTLVPEKAATDWSLIGGTRWQAEVADELADAATPALALCAAALRARSQ